MRIGVDIRELGRKKETGIGRFILNFLEFVSANDKENQYLLFGNQRTRNLNLGANIKTIIIPEFSKIIWDQIVLPAQIKKESLDIFFSPSYAGPIFSRAKLVVTCHDIYFLYLSKNPLINFLRQCYCRSIWKRADAVIAVSQYSSEQVLKFSGCQPQKVRVVYDSVEEKFAPRDKNESLDKLRKIFPWLKDDFILYVGNLTSHKNISGLIEAYGILPQALRNRFQLAIAGERGSNYPLLQERINALGLNSHIEFLGLVSEEDLLFLYNAASALVLVSFWEGFGLPALEAMACATPVVVSDIGSLNEVVGEAGLYVDPKDIEDIARNIERILTDGALRKDLSMKGLNQSKKFKVEHSAKQILDIFRELYNTNTVTKLRSG